MGVLVCFVGLVQRFGYGLAWTASECGCVRAVPTSIDISVTWSLNGNGVFIAQIL